MNQLTKLSPREQELFDLAYSGMSRPQIAAELGLTLGTVHTYAKRITSKLGVGMTQALLQRAHAEIADLKKQLAKRPPRIEHGALP